MEFSDADVKTMPSLSYIKYFEGVQSYECEDCRASIKHKADYLWDNNEVSELPQVYLLCSCSKGLWLPLVQDHLPFDNLNEGVLTVDNLIKGVHWRLCNPNSSKYVNKNSVYFTKCQKKEEDFFLRSY